MAANPDKPEEMISPFVVLLLVVGFVALLFFVLTGKTKARGSLPSTLPRERWKHWGPLDE